MNRPLRIAPDRPLPRNEHNTHFISMRIATVLLLSLIISCVFLLAQTKAPPATAVPQFEDISRPAGLTVSHISTPEQHYIIESMSGGIALFDCDDDGKLDIAVVNGSTVDRYRAGGTSPASAAARYTAASETASSKTLPTKLECAGAAS